MQLRMFLMQPWFYNLSALPPAPSLFMNTSSKKDQKSQKEFKSFKTTGDLKDEIATLESSSQSKLSPSNDDVLFPEHRGKTLSSIDLGEYSHERLSVNGKPTTKSEITTTILEDWVVDDKLSGNRQQIESLLKVLKASDHVAQNFLNSEEPAPFSVLDGELP
eukprot:UN13703